MTFRSGTELMADPDLLKPPKVRVPPMGVAGRVTLGTLPPKGGKSTTVCGMIAEGTRRGIRCGLITLDEAQADTLQRNLRFGADPTLFFLDDAFDPEPLGEQIIRLGIEFLAVDHLGKLAELDPAFGPGSQGDPILWGRLLSPFTGLARDCDLAVLLLDQARRSDGDYAGSYAKAGSVDLLCELRRKDGGLACTPRGRVPLPPFRVDLDAVGRPVFSSDAPAHGRSPKGRGDAVTEQQRLEVLAALHDAEPGGLRSSAWLTLACERTGLSERTFYTIRRTLHDEGLASYASRLYHVTPTGERYYADRTNGRKHA